MARKSRKHLLNMDQEQATVQPLRPVYIAGGYVRLSADDRRKKGNSIATQKSIIQSLVDANHDIHFHDFYIDNAKSGTGFERPSFQKMLQDAENGIINCIIVKDLSRFGRNAIDAGYYIERRFPALGVRFIAIGDDFDSNEGDGGLMLPFKNIVNEAYALDISRKCKAVQRQYIAEGKFIGRLAPYGYLKDPDDCHKLVVDEEAAPIVQWMFNMAMEGKGPNEIARTLNDAGVLPPSRDKRARGIIGEKDETPIGRYWNRTTVSDILADRVYIGDMVQGKTRQVAYKSIAVSPEEWVMVENTHQPVIGRELYVKVQEILRNACLEAVEKRSPAVPFTPSVFKGKVFCGHCGYAMKRCRQNKDGVYWYRCQTQNKHSQKACVQVSVKEEDLKTGAAAMLRKYAEAMMGQRIKLCKKAMACAPDEKAMQAERMRIHRETEQSRETLKTLFSQLVAGELATEDFTRKKKAYEAKMSALSKDALELETSPRQLQRRVQECWELADCVEAAGCKYDLTVELLDSLVEKILVYHDKSFEIVWNFSEPFEEGGDTQWAM